MDCVNSLDDLWTWGILLIWLVSWIIKVVKKASKGQNPRAPTPAPKEDYEEYGLEDGEWEERTPSPEPLPQPSPQRRPVHPDPPRRPVHPQPAPAPQTTSQKVAQNLEFLEDVFKKLGVDLPDELVARRQQPTRPPPQPRIRQQRRRAVTPRVHVPSPEYMTQEDTDPAIAGPFQLRVDRELIRDAVVLRTAISRRAR